MRHAVPVLLLIFVCTDAHGVQSLTDRFHQLQREYASSLEAWHVRFDEVNSDDLSIARHREWPAWAFAPRFMAFAEAAESSQEGFDALLEVIKTANAVGEFDQALFDHYEHALQLILAKHRDKKLRPVCAEVRVSKQSENFLRTLMAEGDSKELRGEACFRLGRLLTQKREMCLPTSWTQRPRTGAFGKYIEAREKVNLDQFCANQDIRQLEAEAVRCFERVVADYADIPSIHGDQTLGIRAGRELYEIKHLAIGATAPDITAADIDGRPMRLSDHRGKVVLLVFWASWCGPCMANIPYEKELQARFAERPFVIVGVNADSTLEAARDAVNENSIPWRSFWNGGDGANGADGIISTDWNVRSWPTVYVLDQAGTIRFKQLRRQSLDEPLEILVKEAETKGSRKN